MVTAGDRRARVMFAVGVAVSAVLLYLAVRDVDVDMFVRALRDSAPAWFLPALASLTLSVVARVMRWRYLFAPDTRPAAPAATRALLAGEFFNSLLPLRSGD